eukprot:g6086.t1
MASTKESLLALSINTKVHPIKTKREKLKSRPCLFTIALTVLTILMLTSYLLSTIPFRQERMQKKRNASSSVSSFRSTARSIEKTFNDEKESSISIVRTTTTISINPSAERGSPSQSVIEPKTREDPLFVKIFRYKGVAYWLDESTGSLFPTDDVDAQIPEYHEGIDNPEDFPIRDLAPRSAVGMLLSREPLTVELFEEDEEDEEDSIELTIVHYNGKPYWLDEASGDIYPTDAEDAKFPEYHKGLDDPKDFPMRTLTPRDPIGKLISKDPIDIELFIGG